MDAADGGASSRRRYIKEKYESKTLSSENKPIKIKLQVIQSVNVAFTDASNYRTYHLYICSLRYDGKIAARTAKLAKRMEMIMKSYKFEDSDSVMILSFLGQFRRACDSDEISESVAT